jgi:hypothetical protein
MHLTLSTLFKIPGQNQLILASEKKLFDGLIRGMQFTRGTSFKPPLDST